MSNCYRCNKNTNELKPFGGPGDPLLGDFTGHKLVKTYRPLYEGPDIEKYEQILDKLSGNSISELEKEYGEGEVDKAFSYDQAKNTVSSSWECRDCIIL